MPRAIIRPARRPDLKRVALLVRQLARFEKLRPPDSAAVRRYARDGFSSRPMFRILVAEEDSRIVGYAFYFFTYSTFLARPTLFLEDLFILPEHRGKGLGDRMFRVLARLAARRGCGRMEWWVLGWNVRAARFYKSRGARRLDEWRIYRLDRRGIDRLARRSR